MQFFSLKMLILVQASSYGLMNVVVECFAGKIVQNTLDETRDAYAIWIKNV